jgi:hypothetical protein
LRRPSRIRSRILLFLFTAIAIICLIVGRQRAVSFCWPDYPQVPADPLYSTIYSKQFQQSAPTAPTFRLLSQMSLRSMESWTI